MAMRARSSGAFFICLLAACGGHGPSTPSTLPSTQPGSGTSAMQTIVGATVNQAAMNTAMTVSPDGLSRTTTFPCPDGGSMSMTFSSTGPATSGTFTTSSRMEFNACRSQSVTINGDPALLMDGTSTITTGTGATPSSVSMTTHMTGGLRFDGPGASGRSRYDCTMTMAFQIGSDGKATQPTMTSTGTITWEQPLGTVFVRPCGA